MQISAVCWACANTRIQTDKYFISTSPEVSVAAVCSGHGVAGGEIAGVVVESLPVVLAHMLQLKLAHDVNQVTAVRTGPGILHGFSIRYLVVPAVFVRLDAPETSVIVNKVCAK